MDYMPSYDFKQLSPHDLEILSRDLLQAEWKVRIESFKSGKDKGIDLRFASGGGNTIVQVKHFVGTGLSGLLREIGKESSKVQKLQPSRYVLVTSVPLSAENKTKIVSLIGSNMLKPEDVIGQEDLNNLLGRHPEIEKDHYKLWLASRAVMERVLHNAAATRSQFKVQQVYEQARRYVQSRAYPEALKKLDEHSVVIIAGSPGIGKTTLANLLLYEHLERGYQAILIQRDIEEGLEVFDPTKKQAFYFDDFIGATFLGDRSASAGGGNDKALIDFIAMVRSTPNARLIMTTREHIYSQAMGLSERFRHYDFDEMSVLLSMPSYSFSQKARILYNHLFFSDLPSSYQSELLRDNFYFEIIKHEKFNPRLIEWLSNFRRVKSIPVNDYRSFIGSLLSDPSEIWKHAYERELTDAARSMLLSIFSLRGKTRGQALNSAFKRLHSARAKRYSFVTRPEDFQLALKEVTGGFVHLPNNDEVEVIDPSVLDLLNSVVRTVPENAIDIVSGAVSFEQIERIWFFAKAEGSEDVFDLLQANSRALAQALSVHVFKDRKVDFKDAVVFYGATFERRLSVLIDIADKINAPEITEIVDSLFVRMQQEWENEGVNVDSAIDLLQVLKASQAFDAAQLAQITNSTEMALLEATREGCHSAELRELISLLDLEGDNSLVLTDALRASFQGFEESYFRDEVSDCRSREQFDEIINDLEFFGGNLEVDVDYLISDVEESKSQFERDEDEYIDQMQDEWKEQWREERATERNVVDMFGSLQRNED